MCMIGQTRCPLERTVKMGSLARAKRAAPHRARTTAVSSSRRSGSATGATATPWTASGVIMVLMARFRRS